MIEHCLSNECRDHERHWCLHYNYLAAREKFPITVDKPKDIPSDSESNDEELTPGAQMPDSTWPVSPHKDISNGSQSFPSLLIHKLIPLYVSAQL